MTATAERARGWGLLRRILPATTRPAAPEPASDLTPAGAAVERPHVYASNAYQPGQTTTVLGWGKVPEPAAPVKRSENDPTEIIVRFVDHVAIAAQTTPLYDAIVRERGLPVWHGEPTTTDVDRSEQLCVWNVRGDS